MPPQVQPQPRIDTLVDDAASGERRWHTEYSGTLWYGEPPSLGGVRMFTKSGIQDDSAIWLPDSLQYARSELDGAVVTCTVGIQAHSSESTHIVHAGADWTDDPRGGDVAWMMLRVVVAGAEPLAISYRVVALCSTRAAPSPRVIRLRG